MIKPNATNITIIDLFIFKVDILKLIIQFFFVKYFSKEKENFERLFIPEVS